MTDKTSGNIMLIAVNEEQCAHLEAALQPDYSITVVDSYQHASDILTPDVFDCVLVGTNHDGDIHALFSATQDESGVSVIPAIAVVDYDDDTALLFDDETGIDEYMTSNTPAAIIRQRVAAQVMLKNMRDERQQTVENLNTINRVKNHFLRMAAHDLKGPVGNIRTALFVLQDHTDGSSEGEAIVEAIEDILNTMNDTIGRFLDVAMLHHGRLPVEAECLEVGDLLNDVIDQYLMSAAVKSILLNLDEQACCMHADATLTRQIVGNLISNAIKYSPHDSTVTLRVSRHNDMIRVSVIDQGSGIAQEERELLFQQFSQTSNQPTGGESSTGLGLWIAKELVTLQGGQIGVDTGHDGGSEFWFEMPYCDSNKRQLPVTEPVASNIA